MSYDEYYLSRKISDNTGLGSKVWMLKLPHWAQDPAGRALLGSLVEERSPFLRASYPVPVQYASARIFLEKLKAIGQVRPDLGLPAAEDLIDVDHVAGVTIGIDSSSGLSLSATGTIPGVPFKPSLSVDWKATTHISVSFGEGSTIEHIRTGYLNLISQYYHGDARAAFPSVTVSVPDNRIVDMVVIGKNYSVEYTQSSNLNAGFDAEATAAVAAFGGKLQVTRTSETKFKITVADGVEYLMGLKTISWDDLDSAPLPAPGGPGSGV
jgi:hypothetical protein